LTVFMDLLYSLDDSSSPEFFFFFTTPRE
jgi:hypothetical protein